MATEAASIVEGRELRLTGDVLWLAITAGVCAVIVGIMCWYLSGELSSEAAAGRPTAAIIPETSQGSAVVSPSPTFGIGRVPPSGPSSTMVDASGSGLATTSIVTAAEPVGVKSSLQDPLGDHLQTSAPANRDGVASARNGPQPAQSASAPLAAHAYGAPRSRQHHQPARPRAARTNGELVPR